MNTQPTATCLDIYQFNFCIEQDQMKMDNRKKFSRPYSRKNDVPLPWN